MQEEVEVERGKDWVEWECERKMEPPTMRLDFGVHAVAAGGRKQKSPAPKDNLSISHSQPQ